MTSAPLSSNAAWRRFVERAARTLAEGFAPRQRRVARRLDVRYAGQSYELTVPFAAGFRRTFDRLHERRYGYADPSRPVEVVNVRVTAAGVTPKPKLPFSRPRRAFRPVPASRRPGRFDGRRVRVDSYRWDDLQPGACASGPALITSGAATVVMPPGFRFNVDGFGNVVVRRTVA